MSRATSKEPPSHVQAQIGRAVTELETPALVLHVEALERNIETMSRWGDEQRVRIRPHVKIHKSPEIARRQLDAGAEGLTTATVAEALAMLEVDPGEILIANQIVDHDRLEVLAEHARDTRLLVAIDAPEALARLSAAAQAAGSTIGVLIEIDVGMTRGGVRSIEDSRSLAFAVTESAPGVELRGVMGYEGNVVTEPNRDRRARMAGDAMNHLAEYVEALRDDGFEVETVSAGGTNTYDMTGPHAIVTEVQAGTYALMDTSYAPLAPAFEPALGVVGTVVAIHGGRVVVNCGSKTHAVTAMAPPLALGYHLAVDQIDEEHTLLRGDGDDPFPALGDRVELMVSYCGGTTNLHQAYYVARAGGVVDAWPILARGAGGQ